MKNEPFHDEPLAFKPLQNPPALLPSLLKMKCPNCRTGNMYINKHIFPLKELLVMPERCTVCNQKMELETGFYYGTGYVSYGLSVGLTFMLAALFAITWHFRIDDNSIFIFLGADILLLVALQPWLMRLSRVIYLYLFVKYGKGARMESERV
jgi:phage FluMu protein Com